MLLFNGRIRGKKGKATRLEGRSVERNESVEVV